MSAASASRVLSWLGCIALGLQGCSLVHLEKTLGVNTSTSGEVQIRGGKLGELSLRPVVCLSGDRGMFRGVDLVAPPLIVRVAGEPIDGLAAALIDSASGERRGVFRRRDCNILRGDIQRTGWRINEIADLSGFVDIDCRLPSGEEIRGSITFEHCH